MARLAPARRPHDTAPAAAVVAVLLLAAVLAAGLLAASPAAATAVPAPSGRVEAPGYAWFEADVPTGTLGAPPLPADDHGDPSGALAGPVEAPAPAGAFTAAPNTDFVLDFDTTVDAGTRLVVTTAAGIWSSVLDVQVPIAVDVTMAPMGPGMLGAAGPVSGWFGLPSFPRADTLYPVALANQLAGHDLEPGQPDVALTLASTLTWDKTIDGTLSGTGQPMLSVAVHELAHGLGHTSWVREVSGSWTATFQRDGATLATPYDRLVSTVDGTPLTSLGSAQLAGAVVAPMRWEGPAGRSANGGDPPKLYSPSAFEAGSSIGHLDEVTFRSAVMTPFLGRSEVHTSVPSLTQAMLVDLGWRLQAAVAPGGGTATGDTSGSTGATTAAGRATAFVRAVAADFVGRDATTTELARWRDHLLAGGSRAEVAAAYAWSDEWIGVLVDGLYRSTLGRAADPAGRAFWIGVLRAGQTPAAVAAQFYASDEYYRRAGGSPPAWVSDLYAEILGRAPDAAGLAFWVARSTVVPRTAITYDLYQSLESRRDRVEALFGTLLGRSPDAGGWAHWAGVLSNGRDLDLATFLAASEEYLARAVQRFG